uniref:Uncharacterized protein n=1 Tax=Anopheles quadriannulatus TaxID=34691 RepID=A0A182XRX5_ANOQN
MRHFATPRSFVSVSLATAFFHLPAKRLEGEEMRQSNQNMSPSPPPLLLCGLFTRLQCGFFFQLT